LKKKSYISKGKKLNRTKYKWFTFLASLILVPVAKTIIGSPYVSSITIISSDTLLPCSFYSYAWLLYAPEHHERSAGPQQRQHHGQCLSCHVQPHVLLDGVRGEGVSGEWGVVWEKWRLWLVS